MQRIGVGEIQKNIALLTQLTEAVEVVDKRRKESVAVIYPIRRPSVVQRLAGKYRKRIEHPVEDLKSAKEEAMARAMKEKYGLSD
ncbi:hypothetical protein [Hydrogenimonas sp.]